jgi:hypothetical protein
MYDQSRTRWFSLKNSLVVLFLVCVFSSVGLTACLQNFTSPGAPLNSQDSQDAEHFSAAWDYAIGRLHYDDVVAAWKEPSSVTIANKTDKSTNKADTAVIVAVWHWEHSMAKPPLDSADRLPSRKPEGSFGDRIELTFDHKTKLLQSWVYVQWGAHSGWYSHIEPS